MILISTQCFPPNLGGIENLMGGMAKWLSIKGAQVTVFADGKKRGDDEGQPYEIRSFAGPKPLRRFLKRLQIQHFIEKSSAATRRDASIIFDSWKSLETISNFNIRKLCFAHGNELLSDIGSRKWHRIRRSLKSADLIIANSNYTADLLGAYEIDSNRIKIFYPPIYPQLIPDTIIKQELQDEINGQAPILITVARLEPRKGIDTVITSLPKLITRYPNLIYLIGGEGDDRHRIENIINELNLKNHVKLLGRLSEQQRAALFSLATIFVMPTRQVNRSVEGFGISYIEAGWYGVPSIASQTGGGVEAVLHNETGIIVDLAEENNLTLALIDLLDNETLRERLGAAALARSRHELCWDIAIFRLIDIIDNSTKQ